MWRSASYSHPKRTCSNNDSNKINNDISGNRGTFFDTVNCRSGRPWFPAFFAWIRPVQDPLPIDSQSGRSLLKPPISSCEANELALVRLKSYQLKCQLNESQKESANTFRRAKENEEFLVRRETDENQYLSRRFAIDPTYLLDIIKGLMDQSLVLAQYIKQLYRGSCGSYNACLTEKYEKQHSNHWSSF